MLSGSLVAVRTRASAAAFAFTIVFVFLFLAADSAANNDSQVKCSKTCVAQNCNSVGIRYGKYCGVGWTGCPGEKPCDDLDACCKIHDDCVEKKGLMSIKCHEKFKTCIKKVKKSGKVGFSRDCSYDTAVPTMIQGMDMAILLSQFGSPNPKIEL
ncbi:probable phospholipase A2 homolog 1 [Mercurialis annua]|uniref:probable phospholipase A2 homolog 1 n=1 Tax=Mercurialis annua TaxID=3986 RepID=UPI00215E69AB|nr:probable phospholipase A2 homolog 1 [Mercurialis annua]XP_055960467.1 probable phospholipase A2 homolog 1 [Mercurialis annua]